MLLQVVAQPVLLRFSQIRVRVLEVQLAVERDDVPAPDVEAVVPFAGWPSAIAEVGEVGITAPAVVIVVPRRGPEHAHDSAPAPGWREAAGKIVRDALGTGRVGVVAESRDDALQ